MMGACMGGMGAMLTFLGGLGLAGMAGLVYVVRQVGHTPDASSPDHPADDPALTALRERFARGEIDRREFEERRRALVDEAPAWP